MTWARVLKKMKIRRQMKTRRTKTEQEKQPYNFAVESLSLFV